MALMTRTDVEETADVRSTIIERPTESPQTPSVRQWLATSALGTVTVTVRTLVDVYPDLPTSLEDDSLAVWADVALEDAQAFEPLLEEGWPEYP